MACTVATAEADVSLAIVRELFGVVGQIHELQQRDDPRNDGECGAALRSTAFPVINRTGHLTQSLLVPDEPALLPLASRFDFGHYQRLRSDALRREPFFDLACRCCVGVWSAQSGLQNGSPIGPNPVL